MIFACRLGAGGYSREIAGLRVKNVTQAQVGPEYINDDAKIFRQARDFIVTYME